MKLDGIENEDFLKLQENLIQRDMQERLATASTATETLTELNITADKLPQKCQDLLSQTSTLQLTLGIDRLDPIVISVRQSRELSKKLEEDYELLELRQKNAQLDRQIEKNRRVIEELKKELLSSKESLAAQSPNPDNIDDHVRQMKQKLASYEEIFEKAKAKFSNLQIPDGLLPKSVDILAQRLAALKQEEENLRLRAEDIELARKARDTLNRLRK